MREVTDEELMNSIERLDEAQGSDNFRKQIEKLGWLQASAEAFKSNDPGVVQAAVTEINQQVAQTPVVQEFVEKGTGKKMSEIPEVDVEDEKLKKTVYKAMNLLSSAMIGGKPERTIKERFEMFKDNLPDMAKIEGVKEGSLGYLALKAKCLAAFGLGAVVLMGLENFGKMLQPMFDKEDELYSKQI